MPSNLLRSLLGFALVAVAPVAGCGTPPPPQGVTESREFDDFTASHLGVDQARAWAARPPGDDMGAAISGTKFVITHFSDPKRRQLHFLNGQYYLYHDEWAWFRLLNGQHVPGLRPLEPHPIDTPAEGRQWARVASGALPRGLNVVDGRLYSEEFYERALSETRVLGAGSLLYVPAAPPTGDYPGRAEMWGFELEYSDRAEASDVLVFFDLLESALPSGVAQRLVWFTRSPWQAQVAQVLTESRPEYVQRVKSYAELGIPGETVIYSPGIVAGRLEVVKDLASLASANPESVLLLGALPEYLPQTRGLLTAVPQTPLAHLNLLAKSRGIVNAYRGGLLEDPEISNLARSNVPVVVSAEGGQLRFRELTEEQYAAWRDADRPAAPIPERRSAEHAPYVVDLAALSDRDIDELAPFIGGKAVGMAELSTALARGSRVSGVPAGVHFDVPERPLAVTVRAYREHLAPLLPHIQSLLADPHFRASRKLRSLALEGLAKFEARFHDPADRAAARSYLSPRAAGPVAAMVRAGGLQHRIRHTPLPYAVERQLDHVRHHFAGYAPSQGLRFRSSSTVEDVEGSSGAGLYDSATGYVSPSDAAAPAGKKRPSLADALRKTWASYFSVEAFEERHHAGMDHLAGDMAVLIHARFDDQLEDANGVFTFTLHPNGAELLVDAQPGAVSVTNPPTDRVVRPESARVSLRDGAVHVEQLLGSSEAPPGKRVLTTDELHGLFHLAHRLTQRQLARANSKLDPPQQRRSLVLDFEFRRVKAGWPALERGVNPPRLVIKQMRPLERGLPRTEELRHAPIPKDVLARARRVERQVCAPAGNDALALEVLLVYTDRNATPDLGYAESPLVASVMLGHGQEGATFTHRDMISATAPPRLDVRLNASTGYAGLRLSGDALELIRPGSSPETHLQVRCSARLLFAAPGELLRTYLE